MRTMGNVYLSGYIGEGGKMEPHYRLRVKDAITSCEAIIIRLQVRAVEKQWRF